MHCSDFGGGAARAAPMKLPLSTTRTKKKVVEFPHRSTA